MGWEVYPDGLYHLLTRVADEYAPPAIYVTENGAAFGDVRVHDGSVHDPERIAYLEGYIGAMARAIEEDVPVKGYFVWSLSTTSSGPRDTRSGSASSMSTIRRWSACRRTASTGTGG